MPVQKVNTTAKSKDIDGYMASHPVAVREILQKLRSTIRKAAPEAEETINYGIPTFKLKGNLVHFAAYKQHIGFYPTPSALEVFKKELSGFEGAKGSIKFSIDKPILWSLITKMVKFRVNENLKATKRNP
jgi:uncharacterized protein YdhG (YjbR/CyaY superfamily)